MLFKDDAAVVEIRATKSYAPTGTPAKAVITVRAAAPATATEDKRLLLGASA